MESSKRSAVEQQERALGALRALYLGELADIGHRRSAALREVDAQLDRLARLLPSAVEAGISLSEIARATDVSRPTLYQLRARYSTNVGDVRLAVLQETLFGSSTERIVEVVRRDSSEVEAILDEFFARGWIMEALEPGNEDGWGMTPEGLAALESWTLQVEGSEDAP